VFDRSVAASVPVDIKGTVADDVHLDFIALF
jgi:hypothetical protein